MKTTWTYGVCSRPAPEGGAPEGWLSISDRVDHVFRWGTVTYDRQLSKEELDRYGLINDNLDHIQDVIEAIIRRTRVASETLSKRDLLPFIFEMLNAESWSEKIHSRHKFHVLARVMEELLK